jgi:hypothetical protein
VASLEFEGCSEEADGSGEVVTAITLPWRKNGVKTKQKKLRVAQFFLPNVKLSYSILRI